MKSKILLRCALLAFFLGLGLLVAGWHGNLSVTVWPISASVVLLSGSATGWRAMAGLGGLLLAFILFLWGLISLATRGRRRKEPLPQPHAGSDTKGQAASQ
jgi:hypothetical protein